MDPAPGRPPEHVLAERRAERLREVATRDLEHVEPADQAAAIIRARLDALTGRVRMPGVDFPVSPENRAAAVSHYKVAGDLAAMGYLMQARQKADLGDDLCGVVWEDL